MAEIHYENQEPAAAGRESFWLGRPIWANPFIGQTARIWKTGWVSAQAELATRAGADALTASGRELTRLLELHRPPDVTARGGQTRSRSRARGEAFADTLTYTIAAPGGEKASRI